MTVLRRVIVTLTSVLVMAQPAWAAQQGNAASYPSSGGGGGSSLPAGCEYYGTVVRGSSYYADNSYVGGSFKGKSFLGLAAKGNIVIGDYTTYSPAFQNVLEMIDRDGAGDVTRPYEPDPTDASLGYDNASTALCPPGAASCFDGDYTKHDGGYKNEPDGAGGYVQRKFYESSLQDCDITDLVAKGGADDLSNPHNCFGGESHPDCSGGGTTINALLYSNHAIIGQVGRSGWFGAWVARDDALRFLGRFDMTYDWRLQDPEFARKMHLPMAIGVGRVMSWQEVPPQ